jgi:fructose 1,6-bisphosphate aldolase/phosphatase
MVETIALSVIKANCGGYVGHSSVHLDLLEVARQRVAEAVAKRLKQYGAGQDLLSDAFSGTVRGMGPGVAEMTFIERQSEPVIVFMVDKISPGAWNMPLFQICANPINTAGLVIDPAVPKLRERQAVRWQKDETG